MGADGGARSSIICARDFPPSRSDGAGASRSGIMQARLIESVDLCPDLRHFVFEAEGVDRLDFTPGQFVSFSDLIRGKVITRAYSLASPPNGGNRFELCLNRVP